MPSTTLRPYTLRIAAMCAAAAAGLSISGCGALAALQGDDVFQLKVGDCLADELGSGEISEAATVECGQAHFGEVFASVMMDDGSYPGDSQVTTRAEEACTGEFESFIGVPYADSQLDMHMLYPTEQTWNELNDREILCIVYDPAGDTTGSLSGAGR
ncbi:hypothetical protein FZ103_20490 [Streptomonospora sp. PA3]|uniref:septum formation family protein n=1 Tax=Streptomonospora sp. PA3 TaxID=2607326 RepID=UPI0012DDC389|nr:septum formation family protein [Streptomonospora sp. PA3]MUL43519.1 hypothetical protein [Streptomonospora sp. PA3]